MPAPIIPAPSTATLRDLARLDALRAAGAGVDGLEVEEERLDHVLRDLAGDQFDEVAGLDDLGGVEADLGALDGRGEDVALRRVGGAGGLLRQVGRESRQVGGELRGARACRRGSCSP